MNFKQATDALLESVTLEDLAREMGVSVQAIRQARASEGTKSYRSPPPKWEDSVIELAKAKSKAMAALANQIRR